MPFPLIAVLLTAGAGVLGYELFKPDDTASSGSGSKGGALPPAKRPNDLPPPAPTPPAPIIPNNIPAPLPIPINPNPAPSPSGPFPLPPPPLPPSPFPIPTPITPTPQTGLVTAPSGVNLRGSPSATGPLLYSMVNGTRVKILGYNPMPTTSAPKGWYNVTAPNGMTGYATAEWIQPDGAPSPSPVPNIPPNILPNVLPNIVPNSIPNNLPIPSLGLSLATGKIGGTPGANLRNAPNTSGAILKGLMNGTIVQVLSTSLAPPTTGAPQGWVNVKEPGGSVGWVSREFCTPVTGVFGADSMGDDKVTAYRRRSRIRG